MKCLKFQDSVSKDTSVPRAKTLVPIKLEKLTTGFAVNPTLVETPACVCRYWSSTWEQNTQSITSEVVRIWNKSRKTHIKRKSYIEYLKTSYVMVVLSIIAYRRIRGNFDISSEVLVLDLGSYTTHKQISPVCSTCSDCLKTSTLSLNHMKTNLEFKVYDF